MRREDERLESWKEIAAYLKRDVRTVQRWEKREGLPVYRHLHEKLGTVYAHQSELVAWWNNRRAGLESKPASRRRWLLLTAAAILAVGTGVGAWRLKMDRSRGASGVVVRQVWPDAQPDVGASLSPDLRYLTQTDWETGDLAVRELATGRKRRLTHKGSWFDSSEMAHRSVISPSGRQVAYGWLNQQGFFELRVVDLDGSGSRVLYSNQDVPFVEPSDWSPDGAEILVRLGSKDGSNQIALISVAEGSTRLLKAFDWRRPDGLKFSPDGRFIGYDFPPSGDEVQRDVFALEAASGAGTPLVAHPADDRLFGWAPDGGRILFLSDRSGSRGAWMVRVGEGTAQGPAQLVRHDMGLSWPMRFTDHGSFYYGVQTGMTDVYVCELEPDTGAARAPPALASRSFLGSKRWPEWSPDGMHLAFVSQLAPGVGDTVPLALTIQSIQTGKQRQLFPRLNYFRRLRWSPDGRFILVNGLDHRHRGGLYRIDVQTGDVTPIVYSRAEQYLPRQAAWSPDGRSVLYFHVGEGLVQREIGTGRETRIRSSVGNFALSPDGRWLAVGIQEQTTKSSVLQIVPAGGGKAREVLRLPEAGTFMLALTWSADNRYVLFGTARPGQRSQELWRVPAAGGEPQSLGLVMEGLDEVRAHPDGRRIAYGAGKPGTSEIWVMENLLRQRLHR